MLEAVQCFAAARGGVLDERAQNVGAGCLPERARERPQGQPLEADPSCNVLGPETKNTPSVAAK